MFARISNTIALQFTGLIFLLLLLNGLLFLAADFGNARRVSEDRLKRMSQTVAEPAETYLTTPDARPIFPPPVRERIRIVDAKGNTLYTGAFFGEEIPFFANPGYRVFTTDRDDQIALLTIPVVHNGSVRGFVQIANSERAELKILPARSALYVLLSLCISGLVYVVALFFARKSLEPAERVMQRLEQFTQDASHELRTPLAALNSSLDLALKTGKLEEGIRSAKDDVKDIAHLVERLLELTQLDSLSLRLEKTDLSQLVSDAAHKFDPLAASKQIIIQQNVDAGVLVKSDPALVRQIVNNLLSNAVKFSEENSTITVKLSKQELEIIDEGVGIKPEDMDRVFDRFFQSDPSRSNDGFGLGLALVKRIVDLHGWMIEMKSMPKKGTAVAIRFSQKKDKNRP